MYVPVKTKEGKQLMPTMPPVARHLIKTGKATPYWSHGVFCIRLNYETTDYTQDIVVGVDPGSKKEGFTVKSATHTYLNIQADAHNKVGQKVEKRRELCISPIPIRRRELHRQNPQKGEKRPRYGGTVLGKSGNLVKNTLIRHVKYGFTRLAGVNSRGLFSIYSMENKRLTTGAKRSDFRRLTRLNFCYRSGVSSPV